MAMTMPSMMLPSPSSLFHFALPLTLFWALFRLGASVPRFRHFHPLATRLPPPIQLHVLRHLSRSDRNSFAMAFPWWCGLVHAYSNELPDYPNRAEQERTEEEARDKRHQMLRRMWPIYDFLYNLSKQAWRSYQIFYSLAFCRNLQFAITGLFTHFRLLSNSSTTMAPLRMLCLLLCGPSSSMHSLISDNITDWSLGHCWILLDCAFLAIMLSKSVIMFTFASLYGPLLPPNPQPGLLGSYACLLGISKDIFFHCANAVTLISNNANPWHLFLLHLTYHVCALVLFWKEFPMSYAIVGLDE